MPDPKQTIKGAYKTVSVKVTQPLIDRAEERHSGHCMIADSIRAAMPHVKSVSVDLATIRFTDPEKKQRYVYLTPYSVQEALIDFDQGAHHEAFSFQLRRAAQVLESGQKSAPDGSKKRPSRANQGVVGASSREQPVKLGGSLPSVGDLSSKPSRRKTASARKGSAATAATSTPKEKKAAAYAAAEETAARRARGEKISGTEANVTLTQSVRRVREFGLKQLKR